jgi:hypothetical protein
MKKILTLIGVAALLATTTLSAQTNNPANTTFLTTAQDYLTSINTNYTFTGVKLEVSTGYKQVNGVNAASEIYAQYDFAGGFDVMLNGQFSGVGSAVNAAEAGVGYAIISHFDTKVQLDLLAGYDRTKGELVKGASQGAIVVEPRVALKKKLTANTFAETAISLPLYSSGKVNTQPSIYVGVGFTY